MTALNISEKSLIYQFQLNAFISEAKEDHEPGYRISENLCPYMRRFLKLLIGTFIMFSIFALGIVIFLLAPLAFFMYMPPFVIGMGGVMWAIAIVILCHWLYMRYAKSNAGYIKVQQATAKAIRKAWKPIGSRIDCNIFVRWYRAIHDKVCPSLNFYDD